MGFEALTKICNFFRGALKVTGTLIGIKWKGKWSYESLAIAGWIFILGTPVGALILGTNTFSLGLWFLLIIIGLMIVNIDDAATQLKNYIKYGVDGLEEAGIEIYEKVT